MRCVACGYRDSEWSVCKFCRHASARNAEFSTLVQKVEECITEMHRCRLLIRMHPERGCRRALAGRTQP